MLMRKNIKNIILVTLLLLLSSPIFAFQAFVVKKISLQGLQGISPSTVYHYLPISVGQTLTAERSSEVIQSLYSTGFFQNVQLARAGDVLIITLSERPIISVIQFKGNKIVKTERLQKALDQLGLSPGQVFNRAVLAKVEYSLKAQYNQLGNYDATVTTQVKSLPRNRVAIMIVINEGGASKIAGIRITGNHAFSEYRLRKQMTLTTSSLFTIFNKNDEYSRARLDQDLQSIKNFYLDNGYLKITVVNVHTELAADKKHIYIFIDLSEGPQYRLSGFRIIGKTILPQKKLLEKVDLQPNMIFSRKKIIDTQKIIGNTLGNYGFAFAQVRVIPTVNEANKTVFINFDVEPGRRIYVRHINFSGNTKTEDVALRKVMLQLEGGLYNLKNINSSERNLNILGFVKNVHHQIEPVEGKNNQVDLSMDVLEMPTATMTAGIGYSTDQQLLLTAGLNQPNFLGSGKSLNVSFSNSSYLQSYNISYNNPYYTLDSVSRGFNLFYQKFNPAKLRGVMNSYTYDLYGGALTYGIPLNMYNRINFGFGYQHIKLLSGVAPPQDVFQFAAQHPNACRLITISYKGQDGQTYTQLVPRCTFNQLTLSGGYLFNNWDRAIFPTEGTEFTIGGTAYVPADSKSLRYYKVQSKVQSYLPLNHARSWIIMANAGVLYGNGFGSTAGLPFFANYYGGGINSDVPLAGFENNSLGPHDEFGNSMGANFGSYAQLGLITPQFNENVRTLLFLAVAKLYETNPSTTPFSTVVNGQTVTTNYATLQGYDNANKPRYSYGISAEWRAPVLGTLVFSLARPFKTYCSFGNFCDEKRLFDFSIGANF